jgi:hypothetical protein
MDIRCAVGIMAAVLVLAGVPGFAAAELVEVAPVRIDSVELDESYGAFYEFEPEVVNIAFTNTNAATATEVLFDLVSDNGAVITQLDDVGTFEQDATVLHRFPDVYFGDGQHLEVGHVRFADGTSWTAPSR